MLTFDSSVRLKLRRTKIVSTIGPASSSESVLKQLLLAGANVFRLNFSHGTHESHLQSIERIRKVSRELQKPVSILGDLSGPKIRVGSFENDQITLRAGEQVTIVTDPVTGRDGLIPSQYPHLIQDVDVGQHLLLDDGRLDLEIISLDSETKATCKVVVGGILKNKKGMNIPGSPLSVPALTEKDFEDLRFSIEQDLDFVALSFVRKAREIVELKQKIVDLTAEIHGQRTSPDGSDMIPTHVIAKIEKPEALNEIEQIVDEADGIMIARGDLGVEMPAEKVPIIQNQLIQLANQRNKAVIVATQMLESMIEESRPTRAEVSDVANAVLAHTDAVMLSGETAAGKYPVQAVEVMDAVLREVESYQWSEGQFGVLHSDLLIYAQPNALARACTLLSQDMAIHAINVFTKTGDTATIMSTARPNAPLLAYCRDKKVVNQLLLYWGVVPIHVEKDMDMEEFSDLVNDTVKAMELADAGHHILIVSSPRFGHLDKQVSSIMLYPVS